MMRAPSLASDPAALRLGDRGYARSRKRQGAAPENAPRLQLRCEGRKASPRPTECRGEPCGSPATKRRGADGLSWANQRQRSGFSQGVLYRANRRRLQEMAPSGGDPTSSRAGDRNVHLHPEIPRFLAPVSPRWMIGPAPEPRRGVFERGLAGAAEAYLA
jgi:hypothetical protein